LTAFNADNEMPIFLRPAGEEQEEESGLDRKRREEKVDLEHGAANASIHGVLDIVESSF